MWGGDSTILDSIVLLDNFQEIEEKLSSKIDLLDKFQRIEENMSSKVNGYE